MNVTLQARFDEERLKKINRIQKQTGLTVSQIFRRLVDAVEIEPVEIKVKLSANTNSDVATREGSHVAATV